MKKIVAFIVAFVVALFCAATILSPTVAGAEQYARVAYVSAIKDNIVTFSDGVDFSWTILGVEDWQVGDTVALLMDDNESPLIYDDTILGTFYSSLKIELP